MTWYAPQKIEEALNETKDFLTPFNIGLWTSLAVLVLLMGGGLGSFNPPTGGTSPSSSGTTLSDADIASTAPSFTADMHQGLDLGNMATGAFSSSAGVDAALIAVVAVIAIVFTVLAMLAKFSYFQAVMEKKTGIRRLFSENLNNSLQFIGLSFLILIIAALPLVPAVAIGSSSQVLAAVFIAALVIYWIVLALALTFVNDFGIPLMIKHDINVIEAARRSLGLAMAEKGQAAIYFITKVAIGIALGILGLVASLVVILALLIPFGILGLLAYFVAPVAGLAVAAIGLLVFFIINLYVRVPIETYKHYFYVLNLEEFEEEEFVER